MPGHYVMGYDERGHCPMLVDDVCTIYDHRPRTCRTYDCRVLAAADLTLVDDAEEAIAERVARWRFSYPTATDVASPGRRERLAPMFPSATQRAVTQSSCTRIHGRSTPADPAPCSLVSPAPTA